MPAATDCPDIDRWQALFDDLIPLDQREPYERHLESCARCQDRLRRAPASCCACSATTGPDEPATRELLRDIAAVIEERREDWPRTEQRQHRPPQLFVAGGKFLRRELHPFAVVENGGNFHFAVDGALAADLRRMRGQHGTDQCGGKELAQLCRADTGRACMQQGLRQRSRPRFLAGFGVLAHPADVVLVLGDIGQMREIAEGAHDAHRDFSDRPD